MRGVIRRLAPVGGGDCLQRRVGWGALLFRRPPPFLAGLRGVAVGTEAMGPEWVCGVVTSLGLDERVSAGLCRNEAAVGDDFCFYRPPVHPSILHRSKQLVNWSGSWGLILLRNSGSSIQQQAASPVLDFSPISIQTPATLCCAIGFLATPPTPPGGEGFSWRRAWWALLNN